MTVPTQEQLKEWRSRMAVAHICLTAQKGDWSDRYFSVQEISSELQNSDKYDWIYTDSLRGLRKFSSPILAALAYAHRTNPAKVEEFAALMARETDPPEGSALLLAMELTRVRLLRMNLFRWMLCCIRAYLENDLKITDSFQGLHYFRETT